MHRKSVLTLLALALATAGVLLPAQSTLQGDVQKSLRRLADYGAFDWLSYSVEGGTVHLSGMVRRPTLRRSANAAVQRIEGVETVNNEIQVLPVSTVDDRIRIAAYSAIYGHPQLRKYLPGGGSVRIPPSPRGRSASELVDTGQFHLGAHAIHIIVERGHITLLGVVNNRQDAQIAEIQAKGVDAVFSVVNSLQVQ
ncbi:MAG TPA: BON domain-containing protein [Acidobacteriota bacterium]|nr:BON domain-containing protein [Acidobacteriota bacterium]